MAKYTIAADIGNANVKGVIALPNRQLIEVSFPHIIKRISMTEYNTIVNRVGADLSDLFIVNGQPFVIGKSAARASSDVLRVQGSARYTREYYGALAAILMVKLLDRTKARVSFIGSFPPADVNYAIDLQNSVIGQWNVTHNERDYTIDVDDAICIDEPLAGYYNVILTKRGDMAKRAREIVQGVTLMIDGGGYTTDAIVIDPDARVDYQSATSHKDLAAHSILESFMRDIQSHYRTLLKGSLLTMEQSTNALTTGILNLRGLGKHDVSQVAQEYRNELFSIYDSVLNQFGGAAQYDTLIPTGGVTGLIRSEIIARWNHNNIIFAESEGREHLANASGLMSFMQYAIAEGIA